ncbi:helix-turn-helix domain-containing protein [Scopulibacillus cellulosilyticus]|uniref:Helix-turn-helix domain-containing protein n=1 Tax=Scopulibacillus cellulosilyticus TaxID=2665665 RepID=A0ABW2PQX3_9BACL
MSFKRYIFLYLIDKIKGERSIYGIYHLLKGKRSSQTIQDSMLYSLQKLFQSMENITRKEIESAYEEYEREGLIVKSGQDSYILSENGRQCLTKYQYHYQLPDGLMGFQYAAQAKTFWKRLRVVIQSLSHLIHYEKAYLPVTNERDVLEWVKAFFKRLEYDRFELAAQCYSELEVLLSHRSDHEAFIFVQQLSGYKKVGLTIEQIALSVHLDKYETMLLFQACLQASVKEILDNRSKFSTLYLLIELNENTSLTSSANKTYFYIKKGFPLHKIAEHRRLSIGTIEDHIVEIAMNEPDFNVMNYIPHDDYVKVKKAIASLSTKRLRAIKERVGDGISYFQIRLVMVKEGV